MGTGAGGRRTDTGTDDGGGYFEGGGNNKLKPKNLVFLHLPATMVTMPFDENKLNSCLFEMKREFQKDRITAIRGQNFIKKLHQYCVDELTARGVVKRDLILKGEIKILTSHKFKDMDVALIHPTSGPLLIICLRSQMSSLGKNFLNYYEMEVGDVSAIHERYPLCVVGLMYIHPAQSIVEGRERENFDFSRAEKMFKLISGRQKATDPSGHYEEIAYLRVNFANDPPLLDGDFPKNTNLRLEDFFDKLVEKFDERNFPLL